MNIQFEITDEANGSTICYLYHPLELVPPVGSDMKVGSTAYRVIAVYRCFDGYGKAWIQIVVRQL